MGLAYFKIFIFFRLFKYGGRVGKRLVTFCHPLRVASFSTLLVQNSMHYTNIMTFEQFRFIFVQDRYASKN